MDALPPDLLDALRSRAADPDRYIDMADVVPGRHRVFPPAGQAELTAVEQVTGFRLPDPVRQLYLGVANGGFGPGYGLLGLVHGAATIAGRRRWRPTAASCSPIRRIRRGSGGQRRSRCATGAASSTRAST